MNSFEINKIIAAIIFTVLVVFGIEKITDLIFYVKKPAETAYKVEALTVKTASAESSVSGNVDIKSLDLNVVKHLQGPIKHTTFARLTD